MYSSSKYLLCTYYMPGTVLGTGKTAETCKITYVAKGIAVFILVLGEREELTSEPPIYCPGQMDQHVFGDFW